MRKLGVTTKEAVDLALRSVAGSRLSRADFDLRIDFDVAAGLYRATRAAGLPVRSMMDCLIAAVAVRIGAIVVHQDRDFDVLASVAADLTCIRELR